jgi:hypothetical protein
MLNMVQKFSHVLRTWASHHLMNVDHAKHCFRRDGKQVKDDYDNLKAEAKVLNQIIERLQGVEGNNSQLQSDAERLK